MRAADDILMAKSNHIFAWPFRYTVEDKSIEDFASPFEKKGWRRRTMDVSEYRGADLKSEKARENYRDLFMLNQYLSISARDVFVHKDEHICAVLEYPMPENAVYQYLIEYRGSSWQLPIASLELHIYRHGMGILFIHAVNRDYSNISDIKKINDLGRRISLPFISDEPDGYLLCADRLGILTDNGRSVTDFRGMVQDYLNGRFDSLEKLKQPADFLCQILNGNLGAERAMGDGGIKGIQMLSDDRMYLICLLRDDGLSAAMKERNWQHPEETLDAETANADAEFQKLLYTLVYVDSEGSSCQNLTMRSGQLEKAVYPRWLDEGTLYSVTEYSMLCITGETGDIKASVLRPFITEYVYMLSLVFAQRIGISLYSVQAGQIVRGVDKKGVIKRKQAKKLINLQEKYVTFKNQILILEASCQEQGIEMYHLLQDQMMISEEQDVLDDQLECLYEATTVSQGDYQGIKWAVIAIVVDIVVNIIAIIVG